MAGCEFCGGYAQSYHDRLVCFRCRPRVDKKLEFVRCDECGKFIKKGKRIRSFFPFFKTKYICNSCFKKSESGS